MVGTLAIFMFQPKNVSCRRVHALETSNRSKTRPAAASADECAVHAPFRCRSRVRLAKPNAVRIMCFAAAVMAAVALSAEDPPATARSGIVEPEPAVHGAKQQRGLRGKPAGPVCATTHKWGTLFFQNLIKSKKLSCSFQYRIAPSLHEGSIVLARNVQESIVSGYLYHKAGRECWVNENGSPNPFPSGGNDWLRKKKRGEIWSHFVRSVPYTKGYEQNPNLCEVLASEATEVGLGIYAEFALKKFVRPAVQLRSSAVSILYLSLEDMHHLTELAKTNATQLDGVLNQMRHHLAHPAQRPDATRRRLKKQATEKTHSTHGMIDSKARADLVALVDKIDDAHLGGELQKAQALFGCGPPVIAQDPREIMPRVVLG